LPHIPQFDGSFMVFVQNAPPVAAGHVVSVPPQPTVLQTPPAHDWSGAHPLPQLPQFLLSLCVSTHEPKQFIDDEPVQLGAHVPELHTSSAAHALPHDPQFAGSCIVSAQNDESPVEHIMSGAAHVAPHMPALQAVPAPHVLPHEPQFALSVLVFTHLSPHMVVPVAQATIPASGLAGADAAPHAVASKTADNRHSSSARFVIRPPDQVNPSTVRDSGRQLQVGEITEHYNPQIFQAASNATPSASDHEGRIMTGLDSVICSGSVK
jgi:hypothetical protein